MKDYNFDEIIDRKGTYCIKYDALKKYFGSEDLISLWVADMDFRTPDFIVNALKSRMEHPIFGYTYPSEEYYNSIIRWNKNLHDWDIKHEWISFIPGIVRGIAFAIEKFTQEGDKVIIQPPVYHPFRLIPENMKRKVVNNPLRLVNGVYEMDLEHLNAIIDEDCKILILSNPHNPAGVVWSNDCLQELADVCSANDILVISDEIHSEMAYPSYKHHPFPTVSKAAEVCSITFAAPSKTFNIAGIVSSYAIIPDEHIRKEFYEYMEARELNQGTIFSYIAATAAYTHGMEWRRQMLDYVIKNVDFVEQYLNKNIPQIKVYRPQASFLVWLDCRELGLNHKKLITLFKEQARLALNDGAMFGMEGNGYMRINVGCPRSTLETALERLKNTLS